MKTNAISGRLGAWALSALVLASCSQKQEGSAAGDKGAAAGDKAGKPAELKIALLLPESKTAPYESRDRPYFEAKIASPCPPTSPAARR
ncbi:hypothetical protein WMF18_00370 [Sorangium sp. So ce315]|uniref:hypothetical protein n=1 Tax=Sorangium sp. So ce315 TaxID=3133299 RepID=UPI003F61B400